MARGQGPEGGLTMQMTALQPSVRAASATPCKSGHQGGDRGTGCVCSSERRESVPSYNGVKITPSTTSARKARFQT